MKSIWGDRKGGTTDGLNEQMKVLVDNGIRGGSLRVSVPPQDVVPLARIFNVLRSDTNLIKKRAIAKDVLLGEYGLKNRIHAKLLLGPKDFEEVVRDPEDIVSQLVELLGEKNMAVRIKAARALGECGDKRALAAMCSGLKEEECWVRYEFADALGKISARLDNEQDVRELCKVLAKHAKKNGEFSGHLRLARKALESFASCRDSSSAPGKTPFARAIKVEGTRPPRPNTTLRMHCKKE